MAASSADRPVEQAGDAPKKPKRRSFAPEDKRRMVTEYDAAPGPGSTPRP